MKNYRLNRPRIDHDELENHGKEPDTILHTLWIQLLRVLAMNQNITSEVKCAICGFSHIVTIPYEWRKLNRSLPEIWICDTHQREWWP